MEIIKPGITYKFAQRLGYFFSSIFSSEKNPLYYLGAITVFLLIIDVISGIYLFIFYKVDPRFSYESVERISSSFIGNIMRGVHRYSSDGLILFAVLHMLHMIFTDRFRMFRWIAWVSGVATLLIFLIIGLTGYLLVWDERAQLTGLLLAKFFSAIPVFGHALMSAFLGTDVKNLGGLFRILLFGHIAMTILLIFTLWVHVMRIARPRIFPPKFLMILLTVYTVLIAVIFPAKSDPPADIGKIPFGMSIDWFYLTGFPLFKVFPLWFNWILFILFFGILTAFPWLIKGLRNPPAYVIEEKCEGCRQCFMDCPYEAISMKKVNDKEKAVVIEDKCAGCGICIGSCTYNANKIPTVPYEDIMKERSEKKPTLTVFRCPFSAQAEENKEILSFTVPCVGSVNAVWMREILKSSKGVMLISCDGPDCYFREGVQWTEERYSGKRRPRLLKTLEGGRIRIVEAPSVANVRNEIENFIKYLKENVKFPKEVSIISRNKFRPILASVIFFIPFLIFYPLTTHKMDFYPRDKSILVLTFKYRSSPVRTLKEVKSELEHMKALQQIVVERSPILITLTANGKPILKRKYNPRGLRKDSAIYVYEEFILNPGKYTIELKLTETKNPKIVKKFSVRKLLLPSTSLVISYDERKGFFVVK